MIELAHRIILTEMCNKSCSHCFNRDYRTKGIMDADLLIEFMKKNSAYLQNTLLRLMGGEPTLHPKFLDIVEEGCKHYSQLNIFTNGSTMKNIAVHDVMFKNHLMGKLLYLINGFTFNIDDLSEYKDAIRFMTLFCVVPFENVQEFIKRVLSYSKIKSVPIHIIISADTQINLIDEKTLDEYRKTWMNAITSIIPVLRKREVSFSFDHFFPVCFFTQEMIDTLHSYDLDRLSMQICCCGEQQMGLIDYNFDIYYCNQTRIKLGSLLDKKGRPKSLREVNKILQRGTCMKVKEIKALSDKCKECHALPNCKIGCYYNALKRSKNVKEKER